MSKPKKSCRNLIWLLATFAGIGICVAHAAAQTQLNAQEQRAIAAKCTAWHQQALSGGWFSDPTGPDLMDAEGVPECRALTELNARCEKASSDLYNAPSAETARANAKFVAFIEVTAGCKAVIGVNRVCGAVRELRKDGGALTQKVRDILRECDEINRADAANCQAWHRKALAGQWFTAAEGEQFAATEGRQEVLMSAPACRSFFELQNGCDGTYLQSMIGEMEGKRAQRKAESGLINAIENTPGCKSIIGFKNVCEAVRNQGRGKRLSPKLQAILRECADQSIAGRTSAMLRPAM